MKAKLQYFFIVSALFALSTLNAKFSPLRAQGTAFTYQGQLQNNGSPASGLYDFRFKLAADPLGNNSATGYVLTNGVPVINGLFAVTIDFGTGIFNGSNYWLDVEVRTNNPANNLNYTVLTPLQAVTPTPYAIFANTASNVVGAVSSASLSGTYGSAVNLNNAGNSFSGSYSGNGANVTNVNAASLGGLSASNFWQTGGNNVASGQFLGSTNNQPLTLIANGLPAVVITPNASGPEIVLDAAQNTISGNSSPGSSILGGSGNNVSTGSSYSIIGGGQNNSVSSYDSFIGGGTGNTINDPDDFIGGGINNSITYSLNSVIAGGNGNKVLNSGSAEIGGGAQNNIGNGPYGSPYAFLGGGENNLIEDSANGSVLAGGIHNTNNAYYTFLGGGGYNYVSGNYASVPGGYQNVAGGQYSFAAGQQAQANHQGAFVWADSQSVPFASTNNDSFNVRAQGGVRFVTGGAGATVDGQPVLAGTLSLAQLTGTLTPAQLPAGVVTNNEPITSLGALFVNALTLTGSLNLPSPATITSGFQTVMYFDANQHLGLGGAAPQQTLSLNGGMNLDQSGQNSGTTANALTFGSNNGSTSGEGIGSIRTNGSPDSFGLNFYTDFAKRLTILNSGKVGIGETAPLAQLDATDTTGSGIAVNGTSTGGVGVSGISVNGTGVQASSSTGAAVNISSGALKVQGAGVNTATTAFIQVLTAANVLTVTNPFNNVFNEGTYINNQICNGNPNAILIVTHNIAVSANTSTDAGAFADPVGVFYQTNSARWLIGDQTDNGNGIPLGTAFNVLVIVP